MSNTYNISVSEPRSNTDTENESGIRSKQKREVYRTSEGKQDVLVYQKVFNVTGLGSENFFQVYFIGMLRMKISIPIILFITMNLMDLYYNLVVVSFLCIFGVYLY